MRGISIFLAATALSSGAVQAADIALQSRIEAVTVYPDGAMVARGGEAGVPSGAHQIVLKGLPAGIDPASVRVEARADGPLTIGTVEARPAPAETGPSGEAALRLKTLRHELAGVQGRIEAAEAQKRAIEEITRAMAEAAAKAERGFAIEQARAAWTAVGTATAEVNEALRDLRAKATELETEIKAIEAAEGRGRPRTAPRLDLAVSVEAGRDVKASVTISYRVRDARWLPVYDAQLTTAGPKPKLALVRRADVIQRTGEDWSEVALTLSTLRVQRGTAAPELPTQTVSLYEPPPIVEMRAQRETAMRQRMEDGARKMAAPAPAAAASPPMEEAKEQEATADATAFSASFLAPGRVTVSGSGARKSVRLASRDLEPELVARTVPALDPTAYLSASFVQGDEIPLLPGEVALTRDGAFVGKGRLGLAATGDKVELGFGADDRIKVERVPVRKKDNDPTWISSSRVQVVDMKTTVTNLHAQKMRVEVFDRIPVSENTAITVEALKETTPPSEKQVGDKRGVMSWALDLAPSEKREIRVAWRMRWPGDREVVIGR